MAKIDDFLDDIPDPRLRSELRKAVNEMRSARAFGLVFEDHIPEEVALPGLPVRTGSIVQNRTRPDDTTKSEVVNVQGDEVQVRPIGNGDETITEAVRDLMVMRRFGEPIYPGLTQVGEVRRGPEDKPAHAVINAENFHALQMLTYTHAGKVDVIYIDPPYNTGDKSWKYNNRFVDVNDQWRHSKWLSMMEKRLRLARRLLNQDSVLIVAIDDHEIHHLGVLLKQMFPDARQQMVTSVVNPRGKYRDGEFSQCEDYLFFLRFGSAVVMGEVDADYDEGAEIAWRTLRRSDISSARGTTKGGTRQFFPIYVDEATGKIREVGEPLAPDVPVTEVPQISGCVAVLPVRRDGTEMNWGLTPESLQELIDAGFVKVGRPTPSEPQKYQILYLTSGRVEDIRSGRARVVGHDASGAVIARYVTAKIRMPLSTWSRPSHNAETGGTNLVKALLGDKRFPYPKSLHAVEDALRLFLRDKPRSIVLDFFAGSGTTAHAVARLNEEDGGSRTSILVTNNEVSPDEAADLLRNGLFPGDEGWEALGIFESATVPRITAAITGRRPDGTAPKGAYRHGIESPLAEGFPENVSFFRLDYLDPDVVSVGRQYSAIAPLLWLAAGSVGRWADRDGDEPWSVPESSNYAVLLDEDRFADFKTLVEGSERIDHVWLVTNSSQSFAEMRSQLPDGLEVQMLYRDYLSNFRVNTAETFS